MTFVHTVYMRLTDSTEVRQLANGRVVTYEGTKPATFVPTDQLFTCGDFYEGEPAWVAEASKDPEFDGWYPDSPSDLIQSCTAPRVCFDNGSACTAGHRHYNGVEYYEPEEVEHNMRNGHSIAANARYTDGRKVL